MSYEQRIQIEYRIADSGELSGGRAIDIRDQPGGRAAVLLDSNECRRRMPVEINKLSTHQIVHGTWRQRWTVEDRMNVPPQGRMLAVSRWERVPGRLLLAGRTVVAVEEAGKCVWLIDDDECTRRLQDEMNDLLLRLAGDGLWIQVWHGRRPRAAGSQGHPLLAPSDVPSTV
ncbi:hypothetical protein [Streptomyces sp. NPDC048386]|uniref:hypothetical protein n=1 Tax=Streptomyces sp. NPDC048386 TaxID=3365541 RepID=UPI003721A3EB